MKSIALLFTHSISLYKWKNAGLIGREIQYYKFLSKQGFLINFLTYGDKSEEKLIKDRKIKVIFSELELFKKFIPIKVIRVVFQILFIVNKASKLDIIKTNQIKSSLPALILKKLFGKPFFLRIGYEPYMNRICASKRNFLLESYIFALSNFFYHSADIISVPNKDIRKFIVSKFKIDNEKIKVLPNWIDTDLFKSDHTIKENNKVLFVGRLEEEKNPLILLKSLIRMKLKGTFIGNGSLFDMISKLIEETNSGDFIKLHRFVPNNELKNYYNSHSILVMPSVYEGQPKVLLEAMACECCILGNDVSGINSLIKNNINGLLFNNNLDDLTNKLKFLTMNEEIRSILGRNARKTILEKHSLNAVILKEVEIYNIIKKKYKKENIF